MMSFTYWSHFKVAAPSLLINQWETHGPPSGHAIRRAYRPDVGWEFIMIFVWCRVDTNKRGSMTIQFPVQLQYIVYTIFLPIQTMFCLWICSFMTSRPRTWNTRGMGSIILTSTSTLRQLRGLNQLQRSRRLWQSWLMILRRRGSCQDGRPKSRGILGTSWDTIVLLLQ